MPEPISRGWRSSGRWESTSAASDIDSGLEPTNGTSVGCPLAKRGRRRRLLRPRIPVRLLDGAHTRAKAAPRAQRWPTRSRIDRGPHRFGTGLGGGCPHSTESGKQADGPPIPARVLRLGTVHRPHWFVRNLLHRVPALGLLPGDARRLYEHSSDHGRAVLRPGSDARLPWFLE